jgi:hypothetical protein
MAYKSYKKKSEVAHHRSKTLSEDIATAFGRLLTLLTTLGRFQARKQLLKFINVKIIICGALAGGRSVGHLRL